MRINCLIKCEYEHKIIFFFKIYHHADIITITILYTVPSSSLILISSALLLYDSKSSSPPLSTIVAVVWLLITTSHTMDKDGGPEPIESYLNQLQNAKVPPPQSERQQNSSKVWPIPAGLTSNWLIVIIVNAAIALIVIIGICYICIRKANRAKRKASWLSSSEPYFVRRNKGPPIARSVSASNQNNVPPPVYTIPMNDIDEQQPIHETNIVMHRNSNVSGVMNGAIVNSSISSTTVPNVNKFRAIGRVTGHMANSNTVTLGESYDALKQAESDMQPVSGAKMDDIPSNPAIYQPPSKEELKSIETSDEDETDITDSEDEENDEKEMTKEGESDSIDRNGEIKIQSEKSHNMMGNNLSELRRNSNHNNNNNNNGTHNGTRNLPENVSSLNNHTDNNNLNPEVPTSTANNGSNNQNFFIQKAKAMEEKVTSMLQKKNGDNQDMKKDQQQQSIVAKAGGSSEPQSRPRLMSAGIQTSPKIWFGATGTVNLKQEPLIEWESHPIYSDPFSSFNSVTERRYFIYIVSESNPYYRKNCIGKITLPAGTSMTLSDLREYLMKADDTQLQEILKRDKAFKFLTETYRFVSQNEAIASIDQVYPTQGIFIKLSVPDMLTTTGGRRAMRRKREMEASRRTPSPAPPVMIGRDNPHNFRKSNPNLTRQQHDITTGNMRISQPNISAPRHGAQFNNRPVVMNAKERVPRRINFEQFDGDKPLLGGMIQRNRIVPTPYANPRNKCANSVINCSNPGLMKCIRCSNTYYCSVRCKNEHRREHRVICSRPPWRC